MVFISRRPYTLYLSNCLPRYLRYNSCTLKSKDSDCTLVILGSDTGIDYTRDTPYLIGKSIFRLELVTMSISTPITQLLGIQHPILLAGMGQTSGAPLAAAVSNAGEFLIKIPTFVVLPESVPPAMSISLSMDERLEVNCTTRNA